LDDWGDDDFALIVDTMLLVATVDEELFMEHAAAGSALELSHAFG